MLERMGKAKQQMTFGNYQVSEYVAQRFRLDGGAMFGSIPKVLWEKKIAADELNRIQLACRIVVLESAQRRILVDIGSGTKWSEKQNGIYCFEQGSALPLHQQIPDVTDVIITHAHFDHAGGVSYADENGELRLSYPGARHYLQKSNWETAQQPGPRERATYLKENIKPLEDAQLVLTEDGDEVAPGIRVFRADGHTRGLQWVLLEDTLAFPSEMMPTAHHCALPYVMGYDLWAERTIEEKKAFTTKAVSHNWTVVFGHDAETSAAELSFDAEGRAEIRAKVNLPTFSC
jgi:glyoxylase-like metal-dependent hydrolase (beta-lactamase superfamily II)